MRLAVAVALAGATATPLPAAAENCAGRGTYVLPPTIYGKSFDEARTLISKLPAVRSGLPTKQVRPVVREDQANKVMESNPRVGAEVCNDVPVTLYVGEDVYRVPAVNGLRADVARGRIPDSDKNKPVPQIWVACGEVVSRLEPSCESHFVVEDQWPPPEAGLVPYKQPLKMRLAYKPVPSTGDCGLVTRSRAAAIPADTGVTIGSAIDPLTCRPERERVETVVREVEVPAPAGAWVAAGSALGLGGVLAAAKIFRRRVDSDEFTAATDAATAPGLRIRITPDVPRPPDAKPRT